MPTKPAVAESSGWVEFILPPATGAILSLILFLTEQKDLSSVALVVTVLLFVNRVSARYTLRKELKDFREIPKVIDLAVDSRVDAISRLTDLYLQITEAEFRRVKDDVVSSAIEQLSAVAHQKRSQSLATTEYYSWLFPMLQSTGRGSSIWAVSMMMDCEWDESQVERTFLRENEDAAKRGAEVTRVFVVPHAALPDLAKVPAVQSHCGRTRGLTGLVITREYLHKNDPGLLRKLGDGVLGIDDRVALIDEHSDDGTARGVVNMNSAVVEEWHRHFKALLPHAQPLQEVVGAQEGQLQGQEPKDTSSPPAVTVLKDRAAGSSRPASYVRRTGA